MGESTGAEIAQAAVVRPMPPFDDLSREDFQAVVDEQRERLPHGCSIVEERADKTRHPGRATLWVNGTRVLVPFEGLLELVLQAVPLVRWQWSLGRLPTASVPDWLLTYDAPPEPRRRTMVPVGRLRRSKVLRTAIRRKAVVQLEAEETAKAWARRSGDKAACRVVLYAWTTKLLDKK